MGRMIRSARGEIIDYDLLKIKQQIAKTPKPLKVQEREKFVDNKIRRRVKKQSNVALDVDIDVKMAIDEDVKTEVEVQEENVIEQQSGSLTAEETTVKPVRRRKTNVTNPD